MEQSLQSTIYHQLENNPTRRAISFYNRQNEFSWLSMEDLYHQSSEYAGRLAAMGLQAGETCVIVLPSEELSLHLLLGTLLLGAVPLLVAPPVIQSHGAYSSLNEILLHVIRKTNPRTVICPKKMNAFSDELEFANPNTLFLFGEEEFSKVDPVPIDKVAPFASDIAAMQLTSGTTGFPRVCTWRQESVLAALEGMAEAMKLTQDDICLNWTPLYHDMGLVNNFLLCITQGVPLVMMKPNEFVKRPALWLKGLNDTGATITWSPNFGFAMAAKRIHQDDIEGVRLDRVRGFWNAAERIHFETIQAFYKRFKPYGVSYSALKTNFGCAENIGGATFSDPDEKLVVEDIDRADFQEEWIARPVNDNGNSTEALTFVSVGRPYPGMNIKILAENGNELTEGYVGEIALDTPSRMKGYLDDTEANTYALFENLLRTGDLGYLRGDELFWVGRVRERINIRGKKFDPSDFEPILLYVDGLRDGCFAAFGLDDNVSGTQKIVILSEVRDETHRSPDEITSEIRNLALEQIGLNIDEILLVKPNTLTKTSSGKRRHRYFRELYLQGELNKYRWEYGSIQSS